MKVQIEIDSDLWNRFKENVYGKEKTLAEVVPTVFEPALRMFLEPVHPTVIESQPMEFTEFETKKKLVSVERFIPVIKRCELCDKPVQHLHPKDGKRVCYDCWKDVTVSSSDLSLAPPSVSSSVTS